MFNPFAISLGNDFRVAFDLCRLNRVWSPSSWSVPALLFLSYRHLMIQKRLISHAEAGALLRNMAISFTHLDFLYFNIPNISWLIIKYVAYVCRREVNSPSGMECPFPGYSSSCHQRSATYINSSRNVDWDINDSTIPRVSAERRSQSIKYFLIIISNSRNYLRCVDWCPSVSGETFQLFEWKIPDSFRSRRQEFPK